MSRPYIIINCAMSVDGKIALPTRVQTRISDEEDMRRVYELRASCDAILVGVETVLSDDPSLSVRIGYIQHVKTPLRIVLDSRCRTPESAKVVNDEAPTIIATTNRYLIRRIGNAEVVRCGDRKVDLKMLMKELEKRKVKKLMVEGGGRVIWSFLKESLFDELNVFVGSLVIGGGPTLSDGSNIKSVDDTVKLRLDKVECLGSGLLLRYLPGN
jgi:2,5-diamino-6-(ribosylamino)-4(3H)-pyrimidinone 5'-phosphate reductase